MLNNTLTYMLTKRSRSIMCFSAQVTTSSVYLNGPGGLSGDGFPFPCAGQVVRIDCWDGTSLISTDGIVSFAQGDRISVYANYNAGMFDVTVRKNGIDTAISCLSLNANASMFVTMHLMLIED